MHRWIKLQANVVIKKYLVASDVANSRNNHFYGRQTNVSMPVDTVGQFLAFLVDDTQETMRLHITTMESQYHEWFDDYDPLTTPYYGQYLYSDLATIQEMVSIIQIHGNSLREAEACGQVFQKVTESELPFVPDIPVSKSPNKAYYQQVRYPLDDKTKIKNYLVLFGQDHMFIKVLQVRNNLDDQEENYNEVYQNSVSVLPLDKAGTEELCQIIQGYLTELKK